MPSLLTNAAAQIALQTLASTDRALEASVRRTSSGYAIETAADNASYWSIATTMRAETGALSSIADALGLAAARVDAQAIALDASVKLLTEIKGKLMIARTVGVDRARVQSDITQLQLQLAATATVAADGDPWLSVDSGAPGFDSTRRILSGTGRDPVTGAFELQFVTVDLDQLKLFDPQSPGGPALGILDRPRTHPLPIGDTAAVATLDISGFTDAPADLAVLDNYLSIVEATLVDITEAGSILGSTEMRVDMQSTFVDFLKATLDEVTTGLVAADMEAESTRQKALQVRQQLTLESLTIANGAPQTLLALFTER
ncbi:flagellin [Mongoliimonas terrestris]|uniref:flagellin N-terminal helical domain-containing protein n=1 Tax=Mongoliimonas terrestris TaxID=1709001 RepID=UPI0009497154|nr:flagellin [Mongoliimonas terrestris]